MRTWTAQGLTVLLIMIAIAPMGKGSGPSPPIPSFGPQDLHASLSGWGFTQPSISNPGPTITVFPFERVDLDLFAFDAPQSHTWLLDLNGNNASDPLENESAPFNQQFTALRFTFVPTAAPGTYFYICGFHGWSMRGEFVIMGGNAPPTVSLTNPDGVAQNRWTGGSTKRLTWTMNDPDGLTSQLAVWVNYTSTPSSGPIAGPLVGQTFFDWTLPLIDASDVRVSVDVADPGGATAMDEELVPTIDSTRPGVASTVPADGATGVNPASTIVITFTEGINLGGGGTVTFSPPIGSTSQSWNSPTNTILTITPSTPMPGATLIDVTVSDFMDTSSPGNTMLPYSFSFTTDNDPPVITISQPTTTSHWTGATTHTLQWTTTDTEDPASALRVWANYSATGGAPFSPITNIQDVPGDTTTASWNVPTDDTDVALIQFTAVDTFGAPTIKLSPAFKIDSTGPTVTGTTPTNGQMNVPVNANMVITFSEAMNEAATADPTVIGLRESLASAWVPLTFSWAVSGTVLTADPVPATLLANTTHDLFINGSARDASDPGNTMGSAVMIIFTTGATPDTNPPNIPNVFATPSTTDEGGAVNISAFVTDDVAVSTVSVNVTFPDATTVNLTMTPVPSPPPNRWAVNGTYAQVGAYSFVVWATDTSGNSASRSGSFTITAIDTTPPTITHTPPGTVAVGVRIPITVHVIDEESVQSVRLVYTPVGGAERNVTMTSAPGDDYTFTIEEQFVAGVVRYHIYAVDGAGNERFSQEYNFTVVAAPPPPPPNVALYVGLAIAIIFVLAVAYLVMRRKRKGGQEAQPPPPSGN